MGLLSELIAKRGSHIGNCSFVVQVGSNDGVCAGPDNLTSTCPLYPLIKQYRWPGILIEPVDWLFEKLKSAYEGHNNLTFVKSAVSDIAARQPFYRILESAPELPWYAHKISGLSMKVIADELGFRDDLESILVVEDVECETLESILSRHDCANFDILQIDAEGHDLAILNSVDLRKYTPEVIIFEHKHSKQSELRSAVQRLGTLGYHIGSDENDIIATRISS